MPWLWRHVPSGEERASLRFRTMIVCNVHPDDFDEVIAVVSGERFLL